MAGQEIAARRRVADAVEAAVRVRPPVTGGEIVASGIAPGPHVGLALRRTRDALVDGEIDADGAFEYAVDVARQEEAPR
jgi:hypothetical protein